MNITSKSVTSTVGALIGVITLATLTWSWNPVALAQRIEKNKNRIDSIEGQMGPILWQAQLNGIKFDIGQIKKTPVSERSDYEKAQLEALLVKKKDLEEKLINQ